MKSMYHEKENGHRSGGNGKKELGSGRYPGIERKKDEVEVRVEMRMEMHLTLSP